MFQGHPDNATESNEITMLLTFLLAGEYRDALFFYYCYYYNSTVGNPRAAFYHFFFFYFRGPPNRFDFIFTVPSDAIFKRTTSVQYEKTCRELSYRISRLATEWVICFFTYIFARGSLLFLSIINEKKCDDDDEKTEKKKKHLLQIRIFRGRC